jgi:hypothetical protein
MLRIAEGQGRYMMGFLRAIIADHAPTVMRPPRLVTEFRETDIWVQEAEEEALNRIRDAEDRGFLVDLDNDEDLIDSEEDADDASMASTDHTDSSETTREPIDGDGVESFSDTDVSEVSMVNHADNEDRED